MNTSSSRWPMAGLWPGPCAWRSPPPPWRPIPTMTIDSSTPKVRIYRGGGEEAQVRGGYLGVRVQDIDRDLQKARDLPSTEGALVNRVEEGSPAAKAGIKRGDVIVRLEGEEIQDSAELIREMRGDGPRRHGQDRRDPRGREAQLRGQARQPAAGAVRRRHALAGPRRPAGADGADPG